MTWLSNNTDGPPISARVVDAGGGEVRLVVGRDTERYPPVGSWVWLSVIPNWRTLHQFDGQEAGDAD